MANLIGSFYSSSLNMMTSVNVIIPDGCKNNELNVLYLMHGLSDNCSCYGRLTAVERYAIEHKVAVIIPEVQRSFYFDMKYGMNYFQYVSKELIEFAHSMFNLSKSREKTYIAGLSMGGYGALKCALRKPQQYKGCAAFSAVCDIEDAIEKRMSAVKLNEIVAILGKNLKVPKTDDLFSLVTKLSAKKHHPSIFMTCGNEDILFSQNDLLKQHFEKNKYDIVFKNWEGDHTWDFWEESLKLAFEYFFGEEKAVIKTPLKNA